AAELDGSVGGGGLVREWASCGPFVAHYRADDGVFQVVVTPDDVIDRPGRDDRHVVVADDLCCTGVVIGVGMCDHHSGERLSAVRDGVADESRIRDCQHGVDHDDAAGPVDNKRVHWHDLTLNFLDRVCRHQ